MQGGQTGNFKIVKENKINYFVKSWAQDSSSGVKYNPHSLLFQEAMLDLDIPLKINKIISKDDDKCEAKFEYIKEIPWNLNVSSARLLGESMAKIHNWAGTSKKIKALNIPEKNNFYDNLHEWDTLDMGKIGDGLHELKLAHKVYRQTIFNTLKDEGIEIGINKNQPKIATHRDFKKHNILSNGKDLYLIDFDFTAIEYVSIEIMSFWSDVIVPCDFVFSGQDNEKEFGSNMNERAQIALEFLITYKKYSKLDIKWESVLYDYLFYLCSSTFPYYMKELNQDNIKVMASWRTKLATHLFENRNKLTKALTL